MVTRHPNILPCHVVELDVMSARGTATSHLFHRNTMSLPVQGSQVAKKGETGHPERQTSRKNPRWSPVPYRYRASNVALFFSFKNGLPLPFVSARWIYALINPVDPCPLNSAGEKLVG